MNNPPLSSDLNPNTALPLQTITDSDKPPERRLANAVDAQNLVIQLAESDRERARFAAKIQGMLDGNPPYDASRLRNAGQLNRSNVNFLEGKAALDAALTPYYDIFSSAKNYAEVVTKEGTDSEQKERWSRVITESFHRLLASYESFDFNIQTMIHDRTAFGKGYVMWPQKKGWHFEVVRHFRVRVPNGTKASLGRLEVLVVEEAMQCHTLWSKIKNRAAGEAAGWKTGPVIDAIKSAMPEDIAAMDTTADSYHYIQQFYKDKDVYEGNRLATVQVAHIFVREFSGKVSHLIVLTEKTPYQTKNNLDPEYLYQDFDCYDNFRNCLCAFFFSTLDGSWNGASGLGRDIFSAIEIKNRLKNSAVDNSFIRAGITLQANSAQALQSTNLVQLGALNILPPDYTVQQAGILGDVEGLLGMDNALDMMLSRNTGVYRAKLEKDNGNPVTAEEYRGRQMNSATLNNSSVNRFYQELDWFYTELYRRVTSYNYVESDGEEGEAVKRFYEECKEAGVPEKAIKNPRSVRAVRNIGNGSLQMRQNSIMQSSQLVPMFNEAGRNAWLDDSIAAMAGQEAVERWNPKAGERKPSQDEWDAMVENGTLKDGAPVVVLDTQNNVIHAQVHLQAAAQAAASLKQGGDPGEVLTFLEMVGPHTAEHLQRLGTDKTRQEAVKVLMEQWTQIAKITDDLKKQVSQAIQEQVQNQQQQTGVNLERISISYKDLPESEKRQVEVALGLQPTGDISASQENMELRKGQMQLRAQKQGQDMAIKDVETAMKLKQEAQPQTTV